MSKYLAAFVMSVLAASASAQWPWEDNDEVRSDYCRGFIVAGLGELPVEALSRTHLWLGWNVLTRGGIVETSAEEYSLGKQQFVDLSSSGDLQSLQGIADGECALGRN
jgi:hypothetical protein